MEEVEKDSAQDLAEEIEEIVEILPNLKLRLEICPRCSYKRQPWDEKFVSAFECPKCGVMYAVALEEMSRLNRGQRLKDEEEAELLRQAQEIGKAIGKGTGGAMFAGEERSWVVAAIILVVVLVVVAIFFLL